MDFSMIAPRIPACGSCYVTTLADYIVDELLEDATKSNFHNTQGELEQLEDRYNKVLATTASFPTGVYTWPNVSHPVFSSLPLQERLVKLHNAIRKLSYLNLFISKAWAVDTIDKPERQLQCSLLSTMGNPLSYTISSPLNASHGVESADTNALPPLLPSDYNYQQARLSSRVPFEFVFGPNTAKNYDPPQLSHPCINMDIVSQLTFSPLPLGTPYTQNNASPAAFVGHGPFLNPPKGSEDHQLGENRRRRPRIRARSSRFFCPLASCSRNQGTLRKPFGRSDNLRTHLKTVHNLPVSDGVRVPKWIAENPGEVGEAEAKARASLSLRY